MDKRIYRLLLVLAVVLLLFFSYKLYDSYKALVEKSVYGTSDVTSLRGWMNIKYISRLYDADLGCLCQNFNISMQDCAETQLWETRPDINKSIPRYERRLLTDPSKLFEKVVVCQENPPGPRDWMDLELVAKIYSADLNCMCKKLQVAGDCADKRLRDLEKEQGKNGQFKERIDDAIHSCGENP